MKKMLIALTAAAAFTGSAYAADLPARMPVKALPPPAPVVSWTGCYIGGGGGYGLWNQENRSFDDRPVPRVQLTDTQTNGGRGYFGTVQGGCDYQFALGAHQFVIGAFADGDWGDIHGRHDDPFGPGVANERLSSAWAVGGRVGWLVFPQLLTYFSAGYTEATFDRQNFTNLFPPFNVPVGFYVDKQTYRGWFLGAGDEYAIGFFPGLFWKTEYRVSEFDTRTNPVLVTATGLRSGFSEDSRKWVQTVRSELVYRFNWGGPVVAKY
jgi:outer membrane immunogenic protein